MDRSSRKKILTDDDIRQTFTGEWSERFGPILSAKQLAELLGLSRSTLYEWIAKGRLDGSFRKRGKHLLFWRDRVINLLFNAPEWSE